MANPRNYVNGKTEAPQKYELRINGEPVETSNEPVSLYWKARRAVNGKPDARAEVEAISGFYCFAHFSDHILSDWERAA